ncbi:MAG: hypothetical protein EXS08_15075 [Planctomycetes bacterium]|nr:hypothetical protein [Planctomycetota bacterium]
MGKDRVRMIDPDFGSAESQIDFGSFQVPLYRPLEHGEVAPEELGLDPEKREQLLREKRKSLTPPEAETPPVPKPKSPPSGA